MDDFHSMLVQDLDFSKWKLKKEAVSPCKKLLFAASCGAKVLHCRMAKFIFCSTQFSRNLPQLDITEAALCSKTGHLEHDVSTLTTTLASTD